MIEIQEVDWIHCVPSSFYFKPTSSEATHTGNIRGRELRVRCMGDVLHTCDGYGQIYCLTQY